MSESKEDSVPVILVGRHESGEIPGCEVIETRNIAWHTDIKICLSQLNKLQDEIEEDFPGAGILLQNAPGVLVSCLVLQAMVKGALGIDFVPRMGIIISEPGPRVAGVTEMFTFSSPDQAEAAAQAIKFANGRAKVGVDGLMVSVTVDPVAPFKLKRVWWF